MTSVARDEQLEWLRGLSHAQRLDHLVEQERIIAAAQAEQIRVLATIDADPPPAALPGCADKDWVHEEVACALKVAPGTAALRLAEASVAARLPGVLGALADGRVSGFHVRALTRRLLGVPPAVAAAVAEKVLPAAERQTFGQFCRAVDRALLEMTPPAQQQRDREYALSQRRVTFRPELPGTTAMYAVLPDADAAAIKSILRTAAAEAATDGDDRTVEQRRADALVDLLLTAGHRGARDPRLRDRSVRDRHPLIQVTVALSTLLGIDEQAADLDGVGPIPAALARRLADDPTGTWRRLVTDPRGTLIDYGRSRYRPPARLRDFVTARDRTCRFPGCRQPARLGETDHRIAWADGGGTNQHNLHVLCLRHHHLKHETGWRVGILDNGDTEWITPIGRRHTAAPPDPYPVDRTMSGEGADRGCAPEALSGDPDPPPF